MAATDASERARATIETEPVVRDLFDGLLHRKELSDPRRYWTEDAVDHFLALGLRLRGPDALGQYFRELFAAIPDWDIEMDRVIANGRDAVVLWTAVGTFDGAPWRGLAPTGRTVRLPVVDVVRLSDDGRVERSVVHWDSLEMLRQLGLMPPRDSLRERAMTALLNAATRLRRALTRR